MIEQLCQFLMPLGLAMCWIFCITFDKRTQIALVEHYAEQQDSRVRCAVYVANGLERVIVFVLVLEVLAIWASSFNYATALIRSQQYRQQQAIQLGEEDEELEYIGIDYEEEKVLFV
jgi:hypothetical protein